MTENLQSVPIDFPTEPIPEETPVPPPFSSSYTRATSEEQRALVAAYLQQNPKPQPLKDDNDDMPEIKAGLPRNFSRKGEDANLWLLAMKAYFTMNPSLYGNKEKNKILVLLNKMDAG